jgi:hypothetical protein
MKTLQTILATVLFLVSLSAQAIENEDHYNRLFCEEMNGEAEHVLEDLSRVDCLTDTHAFEADWADGLKVYEAIGQALYYASETGKLPGILLLIRKDTYEKHVRKVERVIEMYPDLQIKLVMRDVRGEYVQLTSFKNPQLDGYYFHSTTDKGVACQMQGCSNAPSTSSITGKNHIEVCKIWYNNELRDMGCGNNEPYITRLICGC